MTFSLRLAICVGKHAGQHYELSFYCSSASEARKDTTLAPGPAVRLQVSTDPVHFVQ